MKKEKKRTHLLYWGCALWKVEIVDPRDLCVIVHLISIPYLKKSEEKYVFVL